MPLAPSPLIAPMPVTFDDHFSRLPAVEDGKVGVTGWGQVLLFASLTPPSLGGVTLDDGRLLGAWIWRLTLIPRAQRHWPRLLFRRGAGVRTSRKRSANGSTLAPPIGGVLSSALRGLCGRR